MSAEFKCFEFLNINSRISLENIFGPLDKSSNLFVLNAGLYFAAPLKIR